MCSLQTPLHSPAHVFLNNSKEPSQSVNVEQGTSSDENEVSDKSQKQCASPSRRDSDSDSSGSGKEDPVKSLEETPNTNWSSTSHKTSGSVLSLGHNELEASKNQEDTICTMFYCPQKTPNKTEFENRYVNIMGYTQATGCC